MTDADVGPSKSCRVGVIMSINSGLIFVYVLFIGKQRLQLSLTTILCKNTIQTMFTKILAVLYLSIIYLRYYTDRSVVRIILFPYWAETRIEWITARLAAGRGSPNYIDGRIQSVDGRIITNDIIDVHIGIIGSCETQYWAANTRVTIHHHFRKVAIVLTVGGL